MAVTLGRAVLLRPEVVWDESPLEAVVDDGGGWLESICPSGSLPTLTDKFTIRRLSSSSSNIRHPSHMKWMMISIKWDQARRTSFVNSSCKTFSHVSRMACLKTFKCDQSGRWIIFVEWLITHNYTESHVLHISKHSWFKLVELIFSVA